MFPPELSTHSVPPNGNCLFTSIVKLLKSAGERELTVTKLRQIVSDNWTDELHAVCVAVGTAEESSSSAE